MPDPSLYEPLAVYEERKRRPMPASVQPNLAPAQPETNPLTNALEMVGRPLQAVSSGIGYGITGRNPLEGVMQGIQGQTEFRGMADVLRTGGVPELGKLETPVGDITGRGVLGFGADLFADPLSYLPVFTAAKYGAKAALPGLRKAPIGVSQILREGFEETLPGTALKLAGKKVPGAAKVIDWASPKIQASDLGQRYIAYRGAEVATNSEVEMLTSQFKGTRLQAPIDDMGRITLTNGDVTAWNDVVSSPDHYAPRLSPNDYAWFKDAQAKVVAPKSAKMEAHRKALEAVNPEAAKQFEFEKIKLKGEFTPEELAGMKIQPPEVYFPRKALPGESDIIKIGKYTGGPAVKPFELEREYPLAMMRIDAGKGYDKPMATLEGYIRWVNNEINLMDLSRELTPLAKMQDAAAENIIRETIIGKKESQRALLDKLIEVTKDAKAGRTIAPATLKTLEEEFPQAVSDIRRLQSRTVMAPGIGTMEREVFHGPLTGVVDTEALYGDVLADVIPPGTPYTKPATAAEGAAKELELFHGTNAEFLDADISTGKRMFGIHLSSSPEAAAEYGKVKNFVLKGDSKVLDLSDGDNLWEFMKRKGILEPDDIADVDLERYVKNGQLYQYDISFRTSLADDVAKTAKSLGYDVVMMTDNLHGSGDDIAYVVVNEKALRPAKPGAPPVKPAVEGAAKELPRTDFPAAVGPKEFRAGAEVRTVPSKRSFDELISDFEGQHKAVGQEISAGYKALKEVEQSNASAVEGLKSIQFRGIENLWFTPKEADELASYLKRQPNAAVKGLGAIGSVSRTLGTSFDLSAPFIQGLLHLALDPVDWAKGVLHSWQAAADPMSHARWIASEPKVQAAREAFPNLKISGAHELEAMTPTGEYFGGMGTLGKIGQKFPPLGKFFQQTVGRGQAAYDAYGDWARVSLANAAKGSVEPDEALKVGDLLNRMTGSLDLEAMGVGPTQRAVEGTFLFFAPAYTRAALAVVGSLFQKNVGAEMARDAILNLLVAGTAMYAKVARAAGQEPVFDPADSRFMTVQVGTQRIGIATVWGGLAKLLARSVVNQETGEWDLGQALRADEFNPLLRFWRGRTAPLGSTIWDFVTNTDYLGEELDSPIDIAKYLGTKFLPFAVEGLLVDPGPLSDKLVSAAAQEFGLKGMPTKFSEIREMTARQKFKKPFAELDPYERVEVLSSKELRDMPLRGEWGKVEKQRQQFGSIQQDRLMQAAEQVQGGQISKSQYRERRAEINQDLAAQTTNLEKPRTPEEREAWLKTLPPTERAYQQYTELLRAKDEFGETPFDKADSFYAALPDGAQKYIDDRLMAKTETLPEPMKALEQEYRTAQKTLKAYWKIRDEVLERRGLKDDYDAATPAEQERMEKSPSWQRAAAQWKRERERLRRRSPEINKALITWFGYSRLK